MRKSRLGDTDKWPWIRFWFNGFFTGRRTAWQSRGQPIPRCCFCDEHQDDIAHYRICKRITRIAEALRFIASGEVEWYRQYVQGKFGRDEVRNDPRAKHPWRQMVKELVTFISALYLCHNNARLRGNWDSDEFGISAMRSAIKSVRYNTK